MGVHRNPDDDFRDFDGFPLRISKFLKQSGDEGALNDKEILSFLCAGQRPFSVLWEDGEPVSKAWEDLSKTMQVLAKFLGWTEKSWNEDSYVPRQSWFKADVNPRTGLREYELDPYQRSAALILGYTPHSKGLRDGAKEWPTPSPAPKAKEVGPRGEVIVNKTEKPEAPKARTDGLVGHASPSVCCRRPKT